MPGVGFEPTRPEGQVGLSDRRLPISTPGLPPRLPNLPNRPGANHRRQDGLAFSANTTEVPITAQTAEEFGGRLFQASLGLLDITAVYLGDRLGYYRALAEVGGLAASGLAEATGTHPRYAREWLEQQAMTEFLTVDDATKDPEERRYSLPPGHAEVLTDRDSLSYLAPLARAFGAAVTQLPALLEAYRTGGGVSWDQFGTDMRESQADLNRPWFLNVLGKEWFPAIAELDDRLRAGARVADFGTGFGWSAIGMAQSYPKTTVVGIDVDGPSIEAANAAAATAGVSERVEFHADGVPVGEKATFDVVTAFECIHDMSDPVAVLTAMRRLMKEDGFALVVDERTADQFTPNGDDLERLLYGFSLLVCLPDGMSSQPSAGTGTVMRPHRLRAYARAAGFRDVEVLSVEHFQFRFYRLVV